MNFFVKKMRSTKFNKSAWNFMKLGIKTTEISDIEKKTPKNAKNGGENKGKKKCG